MSSSLDGGVVPGSKQPGLDEFQDFPNKPCSISSGSIDHDGENLDSLSRKIISSLSASPSGFLQDPVLLNSLLLASKLLAEKIEELENLLVGDLGKALAAKDAGSQIDLWRKSMEPWQELMEHLKKIGAVPSDCVQKLFDCVPVVIEVVFSHCKKSTSIYGPKFDEVRPQLTRLYRQTDVILEGFFSILDSFVHFDIDSKYDSDLLKTVLDKIGDIAVLTYGMDLKTHMNTWKVFAKLSTVHESLLKKWKLTGSVTRRYIDITEDIRTLLSASLEEKKNANYERAIKCVGLLLKILGRLCTLYRGYCGNEVSNLLVQLLAKLYRYLPPFPSARFLHVPSKISECTVTHIAPAAINLLSSLLSDKEFSKAFFQHGKLDLHEAICYHLLTLKVLEGLLKEEGADFSSWLQEDENVIDAALGNMNHCSDHALNNLRIPVRSAKIFGESEDMGIYETTLRLLCHFVSRVSVEDFSAVEKTLLKHVCSGEFWGSLLSCDVWTYLGSIAPPEVRYDHLSVLLKMQKLLIPRAASLEFTIISTLIGRLCAYLSDDEFERLFGVMGNYADRRLIEPFLKSMSPRAKQHVYRHWLGDEARNLPQIYQDLRRSPSMKNWTRLTSSLRSIGALAGLKDRVGCVVTIRSIWSLVASSISRAEGINREMLLELAILLFDCTQPDSTENPINDRLMSSIYKSISEASEHLPIPHRLRINFFLRDNLEPYINESGKQSLSAVTKLFCCLANGDNPWVRQESFETYAEYIMKNSSSELFDAMSFGIKRLPRLCEQMQLYISNQEIYSLSHYSSLDKYLRELAKASKDRSTWHKCYEPDFRCRDEKKPRLEIKDLDERVHDVCNEIQSIAERKEELSGESINKLLEVLSQLVEPSG